MTTEHANIYEAINAVMQEVGYVNKSKAKELNYTFAGEAALIAAIRPSMVEHGIVVFPAGVSGLVVEQQLSGKGTPFTHAHGMFSFIFQHIGTDTSFVTQVAGEGIDYGDKAASKAMTVAFKYALRQTFCIETGDDPDKYASDNDFGGLKEGNGKRGPSTNAKPQSATQKPPQAASGADDGIDQTTGETASLPLPPINKAMADMDGKELYEIQHNAWLALNMNHAKHFENRWKARYNVKTLKEIPGTFGDFMTFMATEETTTGAAA